MSPMHGKTLIDADTVSDTSQARPPLVPRASCVRCFYESELSIKISTKISMNLSVVCCCSHCL